MPSVLTPSLEIAYEERNPSARKTVVLLHGFPDDARTWDAAVCAPELRGTRTLAPYLRGYGPTRFRDPETMRSGQTAALARDVIDFLDALNIERCVLVGHDWGARAAYAAAVLAPARFEHVIALSVGYGTNVPSQRMSVQQVERYWYQWFFATPRGEAALRDERAAFCRYLWRLWSPAWRFEDDEFERTAASFENPDFVQIVLHSYRQRWGFASGDPRYEADDAALSGPPKIAVPTIVLHGADDGATLPEATEGLQRLFTASFARELLPGVGHFVQRERPHAVADTIAAALSGAPPA